jgi:hypothetical protein
MATTTAANKKIPKVAAQKPAARKKDAKKASQPIVRKNSVTLKKLLMKAQFVTDRTGKRTSVLLPVKTFEKILEELDELEDIRLYDKAKRSGGKGVPMEKVFDRIDARRKKG